MDIQHGRLGDFMSSGLLMTRRIRRTPYTSRVEAAGVRGFTVVNHMLLPKAFQPSVEDDYWHLREHVQVWDVSTQRQVEIKGQDASKLVQWITPRNLSNAKAGDCLYVPLTDENGGLVNDPVLLKLADDHFWLSIADSDVLLWAKGLAAGKGLDVTICEPDVCPLAVQGPKAEDLMASLFGDEIRNIRFFKFGWFNFEGTEQLIARSGYSKQGGFEIYLNGSHLGEKLWDAVWQAGEKFNIRAGCPNIIERIEAGLYSYGNEFTLENNPLECGLSAYCDLDGGFDFLGKKALKQIASNGIKRLMKGVVYGDSKLPNVAIPLKVMVDQKQVGQITSGSWSPRLLRNIGVSMIDRGFWDEGQKVEIISSDGKLHTGEIINLPIV